MEPYGVASAEEVKVENLADHLRIEITAAERCARRHATAEAPAARRAIVRSRPFGRQEIFRILRTINRNGGVSILLVEQNGKIASNSPITPI